ncbi:hypothetical protein Tsubulata_038148 [Turnera subulata]|uniref:Uncharacterized protein n=1 Tax=Turnera subulata TaxID=218843 RepID=A0A9Q0JDG8_9ROSI|nr:hypothetical protein Tsubulata_038148 [Turnera subulata]
MHMATTKFFSALVLHFCLLLALSSAWGGAHHLPGTCKIDSVYQLGDSISDTGNLNQEYPSSPCARLPYGEMFNHTATGRCSNGLLVIDYIARSLGLPLLDAYKNPNATFGRGRGVNFAVSGSTALPVDVLAKKKINSPFTNSSLDVQLDWMFSYFNSISFNNTDLAEKVKNALFIVGEIGGNDYDFALFQNKTLKEVKDMVPEVVQAITDAVTRVIGYGARHIIVPGNFPLGCMPYYLTKFQTSNMDAYDEFHCLKEFNDFSNYHNDHLKQAIKDLKEMNENINIVYGDYYGPYEWLLTHAASNCLDTKSLLKACCGVGGNYDYSPTRSCGNPGVPVCANPDQFMSWDGVHPTQKVYKHIAFSLIEDIFPRLCSS